eukprot:scaffold183512_cov58-Attheya_sp.AAC.1
MSGKRCLENVSSQQRMEWQLVSAVNVDRRLEAVVIIVGLRLFFGAGREGQQNVILLLRGGAGREGRPPHVLRVTLDSLRKS